MIESASESNRLVIHVTITETMRDILEANASFHNRSVNDEIAALLVKSFWPRPQPDPADLVEAAVERAFARRDAVVEPIGSPPPAYAQ